MNTSTASEPVIVRGSVPLPNRYLLQINSDWAGLILMRECINVYANLLDTAMKASWVSHKKYQAYEHNINQLLAIRHRIDELLREEGETYGVATK